MKFIVIILAFICQVASAQVFGVHIGSRHDPDPEGTANNSNPGLYLRLDNGFTVGAYYNSLRKDTAYIGWTSPEFMRVSVTMGVATGYRNGELIPLIVPTVRLFTLPDGVTTIRFAWIPQVEEKGTNVYHLMAERRF